MNHNRSFSFQNHNSSWSVAPNTQAGAVGEDSLLISSNFWPRTALSVNGTWCRGATGCTLGIVELLMESRCPEFKLQPSCLAGRGRKRGWLIKPSREREKAASMTNVFWLTFLQLSADRAALQGEETAWCFSWLGLWFGGTQKTKTLKGAYHANLIQCVVQSVSRRAKKA